MDIIDDIHIYLVRLEHNEKFKYVLTLIKSPCNPVLHMQEYKAWDCYL